MKRRCLHEKTAYIRGASDEGVGEAVTVCRGCGAVEGVVRLTTHEGKRTPHYDGFGVDLETDLSFRKTANKTFPEGARYDLLDEAPPAFAPGDTCQGYRLKGPRYVLSGTDRRPHLFVQRLDMSGSGWGRFSLHDESTMKWFVLFYASRALAVQGQF